MIPKPSEKINENNGITPSKTTKNIWRIYAKPSLSGLSWLPPTFNLKDIEVDEEGGISMVVEGDENPFYSPVWYFKDLIAIRLSRLPPKKEKQPITVIPSRLIFN